MQVIRSFKETAITTPTAVTIGKFDGIHLGHRRLIERTVTEAEERRKKGEQVLSCVCAISSSPQNLLSADERRQMLAELGVDLLIEETLTPSLIRMEPESFVASVIHDSLHARYVATGEDFRFGYGRRGDAALLASLGLQLGFTAETVPPVKTPDGEKISSSMIREAVSAGEMERASELLGYPYFVTGEVVHGRRIGRTIGVPTANMIPDGTKLLPVSGVYCSETVYRDRVFSGVTDIGSKPTVDGHYIGIETYCFDCSEDFYGEDLTVRLLKYIRKEKRFGSIDELRAQIGKDEETAKTWFSLRRCP